MMASNTKEFDLSKLSKEDRSTNLYKWIVESRPDETTSEKLKNIYDEQAEYYDALFWRKMGWVGWKEGAEVLSRHLEVNGFDRHIRILDAGAGTGLVGSRLWELGYTDLTALDISDGMLDQCRKRGCYNQFIQSDLNSDKLEKHKQAFDAIIAIGIFSRCLVRPDALETLISCVKKSSNIICCSVSTTNYEGIGFKQYADSLTAGGRLELIEGGVSDSFLKGLNTEAFFFTYRVL